MVGIPVNKTAWVGEPKLSKINLTVPRWKIRSGRIVPFKRGAKASSSRWKVLRLTPLKWVVGQTFMSCPWKLSI